jgi:hypothetical protein
MREHTTDDALLARFWSKVDKNGPVHPTLKTECWLWIPPPNKNGYGYFYMGRKVTAHRASWWLHTGQNLSRDFDVCHKCDIRACVRPDHLFVGTRLDNMRDAVAKGRLEPQRLAATRPGERHNNSKLTDKVVLEIRARYASGGLTQQALADEYNVCRSTVSHVLNRRLWGHI